MEKTSINKDLITNVRRTLEIHHPSPNDGVVTPVLVANDANYNYSNKAFSTGNLTSAGTTTLYTIPANKEFFLRYTEISTSKQTTGDSTGGQLKGYVNGVQVIISSVVGVVNAATAYSVTSGAMNLRLDPGTAITFVVGAIVAGNHAFACSINGYERENI